MMVFMRSMILMLAAALALTAQPAGKYDYRVLATSKTGTMQKEMNAAAEEGYVFASVMGGDTALGGKEVVVIMQKGTAANGGKRTYKLLATNKTSTMQKEMNALGAEGYLYKGQTVFESTFGGQEVCVIMERDAAANGGAIEYRLLATSKTSTMQKELREAGDAGFAMAGMTVAKTAFGGAELVSILVKR